MWLARPPEQGRRGVRTQKKVYVPQYDSQAPFLASGNAGGVKNAARRGVLGQALIKRGQKIPGQLGVHLSQAFVQGQAVQSVQVAKPG